MNEPVPEWLKGGGHRLPGTNDSSGTYAGNVFRQLSGTGSGSGSFTILPVHDFSSPRDTHIFELSVRAPQSAWRT